MVGPRLSRPLPRWPLVAAVYLVLSVLLHLQAFVSGVTDHAQAAGGDVAISVWCMRWAAYAVTHGHNPFFSDWVNYPGGVNLLDNTSCLLLGVVMTPVTLWLGAVATFNILQTLALALSALGAYALLRRLRCSWGAAFAGGLLYGFSPYMVSAGWAHLHGTFLIFPPLIMLCLYDLTVGTTGSPVRKGVRLGLLVAGQFFVSLEMLAATAEFCLLGIAVLAVLERDRIRARFRRATIGLLAGTAVAVALLAYPIYFALLGPEHGKIAAPVELASLYSNDLLGAVVPTSNQLLATSSLGRLGDEMSGAAIQYRLLPRDVTSGAYIGLPLVVFLLFVAVRYRRSPAVRYFTVMTLLVFIGALGPLLKVKAHATSLWLPEHIAYSLPLLEATYPYRYGAFLALGAGILLALGLDQLREDLARGGSESWPALSWVRTRAVPVVGGVAAVALLPLVPARVYTAQAVSTPEYFQSSSLAQIPEGSVILTYPPPAPATSATMMWQADAGLRFKMIGAYMFGVDDRGEFVLVPNHGTTATGLYDIWAGTTAPGLTPDVLKQSVVRDVKAWHVFAVVVALDQSNARTAVSLLSDALGRAPVESDGVAAWYGLDR